MKRQSDRYRPDSEWREALEMASATIERLHRHAAGSAQGTLDVISKVLGR